MRILIANPNMSERMTELMVREAERHCRPDTQITGVSAAFGVAYIGTRSEMAIAGHALLDCLARHHEGHDAIVVGAFCHGFVAAAKELMPIPVIGIAEAAMRAAQIFGQRLAIIGISAPGRAANEEIVSDLSIAPELVSIHLLPLSGTELADDQARADAEVVKLGNTAVAEAKADVLVLGGAAFAGMAERIAGSLPVPIISPIPYAIGIAELAVHAGWHKPRAGRFSPPGEKATAGLSPELAAFYVSNP